MFFLSKKKSKRCERKPPIISNLKYKIWAYRPSIKGTKPLFIVIKVIIIIKQMRSRDWGGKSLPGWHARPQVYSSWSTWSRLGTPARYGHYRDWWGQEFRCVNWRQRLNRRCQWFLVTGCATDSLDLSSAEIADREIKIKKRYGRLAPFPFPRTGIFLTNGRLSSKNANCVATLLCILSKNTSLALIDLAVNTLHEIVYQWHLLWIIGVLRSHVWLAFFSSTWQSVITKGDQ